MPLMMDHRSFDCPDRRTMSGNIGYQRISEHEHRGICAKHPDYSCTFSTYEEAHAELQVHLAEAHPKIAAYYRENSTDD